MKCKSLTVLLTAATLSLSAGCASTGLLPAWTRTSSMFHRGTDTAAESGESAVASSKRRDKASRNAELSPEFREAQKTFKNTEKTLLAWARYQEDLGEYAEARKMYRELQIAYPRNLEAHLGMARIEILTGRSEQAEQILTELKKQYPDNSSVMVELGRMYSKQEDWGKAIGEFEDACDVEPDDQNCRYELGVALAHAGKFDQALSHLKFAVGAPAANYNIGYILHEQGKDADAFEWIQNALQMHPDQRTAEKSKAMLAKMMPPGTHPSETSAMAHNHSPAAESAAGRDEFGTPHHPSATHNIASQFTPAPLVTNRNEPVPAATAAYSHSGAYSHHGAYSNRGTYPNSGTALPSAEPGNGMRGHIPQPARSAPPFHTVSHTTSDAAGKAAYSSSQPPQWNGPSGPAIGQSSVSPAVPQDPPNWRARKNQGMRQPAVPL